MVETSEALRQIVERLRDDAEQALKAARPFRRKNDRSRGSACGAVTLNISRDRFWPMSPRPARNATVMHSRDVESVKFAPIAQSWNLAQIQRTSESIGISYSSAD